ncbi:MAG: LCP family protein [Patescibacteria group bacterium]|jgi:LCP family protein required for cell wall assembly
MPEKDILATKNPSTPKPQPGHVQAPGTFNTPKIAKHHLHLWRITFGVLIVFALIIIGLGLHVMGVGSKVFHGNNNSSTLSQIGKLIIPGDRELRNDGKHRTNILLVGYGGEGHDGAYLADTIIFASLDQASNEVAMLSIPRDFLVELPGYGFRKINNALAFGMTGENPEGGNQMLIKAVEEITGQTVHYYAKADFDGFKKAVDDLGGIDVTVDTAFNDFQYPTYNYGYQTIKFESGQQHFNGEKALQFVRSRHGTNGEGSDFARSKRQQKILFAFREKALNAGTLTNPGKINSLLSTLGNHVSSNFELWEVSRLAAILKSLSPEKIVTRVLESVPDGLVKAATGLDGAYVLQPRIGLGNYQEIQALAANIFQLNQIAREAAPIQIQNATASKYLGNTAAHTLRGFNIDVISSAELKTIRYENSMIVDLSGGLAPQTISMLQKKYNATVVNELPADVTLLHATEANSNYNTNDNSNQNTNTATEIQPKILLLLGQSAVTIVNSEAKPNTKILPQTSST